MTRQLTDTQWKLVHKAVYAYRNGNTSLVAGVKNRRDAKYLCAEFNFEYTRTDLGNDNSYHWIDVGSIGTDENRIYVETPNFQNYFGKGYYLRNDNSVILHKDYLWILGQAHDRTQAVDGGNRPMLKIIRRTPGGVIIDEQNEVFRDYGLDSFVWQGTDDPFELCDRLGCVHPRRYSYRLNNPSQNYLHIPNYQYQAHDPEAFLRSKGIID